MSDTSPSSDRRGSRPATGRLLLAQHAIDRDDRTRADEAALEQLRTDDATRWLLQHRDTALVGPAAASGLPDALDLRAGAGALGAEPLYLGRTTAERRNPDGRIDPVGIAVFATALDDFDAGELEPDRARWAPLTEVAPMLPAVDTGLFTEALALRNFHRAHRFSPRTGEPLEPIHGGWVLRGRDSGAPVYPRTDTAVIVLVTDAADRILLGANTNWQPRRFSLLAGFVEPGESFEAAAAREVLEEAGARIRDIEYVASQPWPFPASLMVGMRARLDPAQDPTSVRPDESEIAEVRWFTRAELEAAPHLLPGRASIARALIEQWYGGRID